VQEMKFPYNILARGKFIKEMPGSVASGTHCTILHNILNCVNLIFTLRVANLFEGVLKLIDDENIWS